MAGPVLLTPGLDRQDPNVTLVSSLLKLQSACLEETGPKTFIDSIDKRSSDFMKKLQCLSFRQVHKRRHDNEPSQESPTYVLERSRFDALRSRRYVALSYTWESYLEGEDPPKGGYLVEEMKGGQMKPSPVRDSVFRRIKKYMDKHEVKNLWIDQHCVDQSNKEKKEVGMQTMDQVYTRSRYPAALLYEPLSTTHELQILADTLAGRYVLETCGNLALSPTTSPTKALEAVRLLKRITSDPWFIRGWTFQENYLAGKRMALLIPHCPSLNEWKASDEDESRREHLGLLDGEACINSVDFYKSATKLCLACDNDPGIGLEIPEDLEYILKRAGKYTILLQTITENGVVLAPKSMSPTIISDLAVRRLTNNWDRLPIAANCCKYSVRFNSSELQSQNFSLNLATVALCLRNGEILSNNSDREIDKAAAKQSTFAEFLDGHFFDGMQAPRSLGALTFNKGCRFPDAKMTSEGIQTEGYLWQLKNLIPPGPSSDSQPQSQSYDDECLGDYELSQLQALAEYLSSRDEEALSRRIERFISSKYIDDPQTFSQDWMIGMAKHLVAAVEKGKMLCTAQLVDKRKRGIGIFIIDEEGYERWRSDTNGSQISKDTGEFDEEASATWLKEHPRYIFTAFRPQQEVRDMVDNNDIDRHVSMEVECQNAQDPAGTKPYRLLTKRWIHGLCFFEKCWLDKVVFPWPASFHWPLEYHNRSILQ